MTTIDLRGSARTGNASLDAGKDALVTQWTHRLTRDDPLPASLLACARLLSLNQMELYEVQGSRQPQQHHAVVSPRNELETHVFLRAVLRSLLPQGAEQDDTAAVVAAALAKLDGMSRSTVAAANEEDPLQDASVDELKRQLRVAGAVGVDRVALGAFEGTTGRGLLAVEAVEDADVDRPLLGIPESFLVTAKAAQGPSSKIGGMLRAIEGLDDDSKLFLFVIYDAKVNKGMTKWRAYWDSLPEAFTTPLQMDEEAVDVLRGTVLHGAVQSAQAQLEALHTALFPLLSTHYPTLFPLHVFSLDTFRWAKSLLDSRALRVRIDGELTTCLVPLVDMLNHRPNAHCWRRWFDQDKRQLCIDANMPIAKGAQVFLSYGPLRNWELLQDYGFVGDDANPYDSFAIEFESPADETKRVGPLLERLGLTSDHHFKLGQPPTPNCLAYLRTIVATYDELQTIESGKVDPRARSLSKRNELQVVSTIRQTVRFLLNEFHPSTLPTAESSASPSPLRHLALRFAREQRAILESILVWADAQRPQ